MDVGDIVLSNSADPYRLTTKARYAADFGDGTNEKRTFPKESPLWW